MFLIPIGSKKFKAFFFLKKYHIYRIEKEKKKKKTNKIMCRHAL